MRCWVASCLLLIGLPTLADSAEVGVDIFGIFKPRSVRLAAKGDRPMSLVAVSADGRRQSVQAGSASIRCGGRSPLEIRIGARTLEAATLEASPGKQGGLLEVFVPGAKRSRPYAGWFRINERAGRCQIVNRVELEHYVGATACRELGSAPAEALRAQAVLVRTWALGHRGRHAAGGADFCDLTHCQVYEGASACGPVALATLVGVRGQVLLDGDRLADVAYSSTCGGHTARAEDIWGPGSGRAYLEGRKDGDPALCSASPHFRWRFETDRAAVCAAVRKAEPALGTGPCRLEVVERGTGGWIRRVKVATVEEIFLTGEQFHLLMGRAFGWGKFKSANFVLQPRGKRLAFVGRGLGHGVGMCQYGAMTLARKGAGHLAILEHYFPGSRVGPMP